MVGRPLPLPLGCGGPRAQRAVSSSFVKFRQIDGIDETARWVPHHPRPWAQGFQSLPLLVTMHMVLYIYMERTSWFVCHVMPVLRMQSKGAAEGEVSRESEASRNGCPACQSEFAF